MCVYFSFIFLFFRLRSNKIKTAFRTKCVFQSLARKNAQSNELKKQWGKNVNRIVLRSFAFLVHSYTHSVCVCLFSIITQLIQLFNSTLKVSFKPMSGRSNHSWRQRHNFHFYSAVVFFQRKTVFHFAMQCNTQNALDVWFSLSFALLVCDVCAFSVSEFYSCTYQPDIWSAHYCQTFYDHLNDLIFCQNPNRDFVFVFALFRKILIQIAVLVHRNNNNIELEITERRVYEFRMLDGGQFIGFFCHSSILIHRWIYLDKFLVKISNCREWNGKQNIKSSVQNNRILLSKMPWRHRDVSKILPMRLTMAYFVCLCLYCVSLMY